MRTTVEKRDHAVSSNNMKQVVGEVLEELALKFPRRKKNGKNSKLAYLFPKFL